MMPPVEVPPTNRAEYSSLLEIVLRLANDLDNKLPVFSIVSKNEENTRKLLSAVCLFCATPFILFINNQLDRYGATPKEFGGVT